MKVLYIFKMESGNQTPPFASNSFKGTPISQWWRVSQQASLLHQLAWLAASSCSKTRLSRDAIKGIIALPCNKKRISRYRILTWTHPLWATLLLNPGIKANPHISPCTQSKRRISPQHKVNKRNSTAINSKTNKTIIYSGNQ